MSRTIALTGATGFVGSALVKQLAATGWRIRALVRPASIDRRPDRMAVEWVTGALEDMESLRRLVKGADTIIHCAGAVRGACSAAFDRINVTGVTRLVRAVREQHAGSRFFLISSLAAREPHLSDYAASKRKGEEAIASIADQMPWVVLRPSAVYGPGDREMLPLFQWMCRGIAPVIGSNENRVSLLYVTDLAEAIVHLLKCDTESGGCYEIHDGHEGGYLWEDVMDTVARINKRKVHRIRIPVPLVRLTSAFNLTAAKIFGHAPMLTPGKVRELTHPDWAGDNSALTRDTGWIPRITLQEGLQQTLKK